PPPTLRPRASRSSDARRAASNPSPAKGAEPAVKDLRVGTRGSPLALWQANEVAARIRQTGGPACQIVTIKTSGDRLQDAPLSEAGGKRLFVKEIEDALIGGEIDLAVHSAKDMSAVLPEGLTVPAALAREDPRDAIVLAAGSSPADLHAALAAL